MKETQQAPAQYRDIDVYMPDQAIMVSHSGQRLGRIESLVTALTQKPFNKLDDDEQEFMLTYDLCSEDLVETVKQHGVVNVGGGYLAYWGDIH